MNTKTTYTIALTGNPNVGKTTVFNILTGSHQTVGNWPGVTVEHKKGRYTYNDTEISVIDLPGLYSLTTAGMDEKVTRNYILQSKPDLLVNVVDASNLERNLYLTLQLIEMRVPVLIVLTMLDVAEQNKITIDIAHLQKHLGCAVVPLQIYQKKTESLLKDELLKALETNCKPLLQVSYDDVVETGLIKIMFAIDYFKFDNHPDEKWIALKLMEQDEEYLNLLNEQERALLKKVCQSIEKHRRHSIQNAIADDRYAVIHGLTLDVVKRKTQWRETLSDKVDTIALSSIWGLPIFFFVMFLVFSLTIKASEPIVGLIQTVLDWLLISQAGALFSIMSLPQWLNDFLSNGIGGGVVTIASFVPPIFFIFISLAWLEDSGYMSRAAFVADKFMRKIGLPGKAFIPLLVGFGCTVPAIMATRSLENKRDRIMTSLLAPFMSCGAKLPVYTFLCMIFFPKNANLVVFGLYMTGIMLAMLTGLLLKKTLFKTQPADFIMELPAYHLPTLNGVMMHAWHRLKDFVLRAGKTILTVIVLMYILQMLTVPVHSESPNHVLGDKERISVLEMAGKAINPIFAPMGINKDNWHASVALISGLFAKEAVVGSLQSLYAENQDTDIDKAIQQHFGSVAAIIAYLLFILIYSPCAAALTMLWKEHGRSWMIFAFTFLTLQAWLIATMAYQVGNWSVNQTQSVFWLLVVIAVFIIEYIIMFLAGRRYAPVV